MVIISLLGYIANYVRIYALDLYVYIHIIIKSTNWLTLHVCSYRSTFMQSLYVSSRKGNGRIRGAHYVHARITAATGRGSKTIHIATQLPIVSLIQLALIIGTFYTQLIRINSIIVISFWWSPKINRDYNIIYHLFSFNALFILHLPLHSPFIYPNIFYTIIFSFSY